MSLNIFFVVVGFCGIPSCFQPTASCYVFIVILHCERGTQHKYDIIHTLQQPQAYTRYEPSRKFKKKILVKHTGKMNIVVAILCATSKVNIVKFFITAILFQNIYLRDKPISPNYLKKKHKRLTPPRISLKLFTSFFLFSSICLVRSSLSVRSLIDLCVFWAFIVFITKQFFFSLSRF